MSVGSCDTIFNDRLMCLGQGSLPNAHSAFEHRHVLLHGAKSGKKTWSLRVVEPTWKDAKDAHAWCGTSIVDRLVVRHSAFHSKFSWFWVQTLALKLGFQLHDGELGELNMSFNQASSSVLFSTLSLSRSSGTSNDVHPFEFTSSFM